jgi:hypothetical protein
VDPQKLIGPSLSAHASDHVYGVSGKHRLGRVEGRGLGHAPSASIDADTDLVVVDS